MPWDELLDAAYRVGITEERFWRMNMRKLHRAIDAYSYRRKVDRVVLYNTIGPMMHSGKGKFKPITIDDLTSAPPEDFDERWRRAMQLEAECKARHEKLRAAA